ncbi:MAG TPA: bifunctional demethylmenaquinone methyltransferase/2-methoxy-6-polyprenyl-1,4-benzoquinol methylase UbiE [Patescibacteria group bacterium]|nr:bifunctional demethylmenaquinone methyltransferase/2-methoxy-6-polyprenyl-1,4-benzoquinol methylase UbiE [Patescibacteria group bacterium]
MQNPEREWFGTRKVSAREKTDLVRGVFDSVADKYDLMNDLMSGGRHRLWKDRFVRQIRPRPGMKCLDVAGGTGDIAFRLKRKGAQVTVSDINEEMLRVGRDRAIDRGWLALEWVPANAEDLPFDDESFDLYTIAFGLRNVTHIDKALAEAARVLKPGGKFFCLEFSRVEEPFIAKIYDAWSFNVIPRIGAAVAKDRESYQYLVESIRKFPPQKQLVRRMAAAGLSQCRYTNLDFGVVAIHQGVKV